MRVHFLLRLLPSYFVVAALVLLLLNAGAIILYRSIYARIEQDHLERTAQFAAILDRELDTANNLVNRLAINRYIIELQQLKSPSVMKDQYPIFKAKDYITTLVQDYHGNFYLYFRNNDLLISKNNVYPSLRQYYGRLFRFASLEYEEAVSSLLAAREAVRYEKQGPQILSLQEREGALYIREINSAQLRGNAVMVYVLDKADLEEELARVMGPGHSVELRDGSGPLLALGGDFSGLEEKDLLVHSSASVNGLTIRSAVPRDIAYAELDTMRHVLLAVNLLSILTALLFLAFQGMRNYRKLSDVLPALEEGRGRLGGDLYATLNDTYAALLVRNSQMQETLSRQTLLTRSMVIRNLINGVLPDGPEQRELFDRAGLDLAGHSHNAVLLSFDHIPPDCLDSVSRSFDQAFSPIGYTHRYDERCWMVLTNFTDDQAREATELIQDAYALFLGLLEPLGERLRLQCRASGLYTDLAETGTRFWACMQETGPDGQASRERVCWIDDLRPNKQDAIYFSDEAGTRLSRLIRGGDAVGAMRVFADVVRANLEERALGRFRFKLLVAQLQLLFYHCAINDCYGLIERDMLALEQASSARDLEERGMAIIRILCDFFAGQQENQGESLDRAMIRYIDENFGDPALSLKRMAASFGFSESYFSIQFKELVHENFSTFLDKKRISHADLLICGTSIKFEEVARLSGYNSTNTFNKAYKRSMGMTPSARRSSYRGAVQTGQEPAGLPLEK